MAGHPLVQNEHPVPWRFLYKQYLSGMERVEVNEDHIRSLIGSIHNAALEPALWPEILESLSDGFAGGGSVAFGVSEFVGERLIFPQYYQARLAPDALEIYLENYSTPNRNPFVRAVPFSPANHFFPDSTIMSEAEMVRTDFYQDVLRSYGLHHNGFVKMPFDQRFQAILNFARPKGMEQLNKREAVALNALVPHLSRALQVQHRFCLLKMERDAAFATLDELPMGVVMVNGAGDVLFVNRVAAAIIDLGDGLSVRRKRLIAATGGLTTALDKLIGQAAATAGGRGLNSGGALALPRPSLKRPLALLVAPLRSNNISFGLLRPAAVVFVTDPERAEETPPEVLTRLYRLTPAEARLATTVLTCESLPRAAEAMGVSITTARTHLRHIFEKTGTRRQAELVALLLKGPAGLHWN